MRVNKERIAAIADVVSACYAGGIEPLLVTSGAVAAGMEKNNLLHRPTIETHVRALAAEGQPYLMSLYQAALQERGIGAYQLVVSHTDIETEILRKIVEHSFKQRKLCIFNTNDATVATLKDNDPLAAEIAVAYKANALIMISEAGSLGSGGGSSKGEALAHAKSYGIKTAVMTHDDLQRLL